VKPSATTIRTGVIAAIALVVLGAASATPWIITLALPRFTTPDRPMPETPQVTVAPQEPVQRDQSLTHIIATVAAILFALLVTAVIAYGLYRLVQRLRAAWQPEDDHVESDQLDGDVPGEAVTVDIASLATAVARAEAHLAGVAGPADAVVAAWIALEDEAALQGTGRDPAQTPTEFTSVLLQHTPAPADAVAVLRSLYHRARFTSHPVTPDDVRRARESLARIAAALDGTAVFMRPAAGGPSS
jgi:hypothetical protein